MKTFLIGILFLTATALPAFAAEELMDSQAVAADAASGNVGIGTEEPQNKEMLNAASQESPSKERDKEASQKTMIEPYKLPGNKKREDKPRKNGPADQNKFYRSEDSWILKTPKKQWKSPKSEPRHKEPASPQSNSNTTSKY